MNKYGPLGAAAVLATGVVVMATAGSSSAAEEADAPTSIVEDYVHPDAAGILARHDLKVFKGDGHIIFHSSKTYDEGGECPTGLLQVEKSTPEVEPFGVFYCFTTIGTKGFLTLEVPGTFGLRGGSTTVTATAELPDGTELDPYTVAPGARVPVAPGTGSETPEAILLELRMG